MDIEGRIALQLGAQKPFVLYSKPKDEEVVGVFQEDTATYTTEDFKDSGFVFAPFNGEKALLIPKDKSDVISIFLTEKKEQVAEDVVAWLSDDVERKAFERLVERGVLAIEAGAFEKVVLSRKISVSMSAVSLFARFKRLKQNYPNAYCSLFYHPEAGLWMGATPEQLLKIKGTEVHTMALAGTQKYRGTEQVTWGHKEQEEQQFVTDFIVESLQDFVQDLEVSEPFTARAAQVLHICTAVKARLRSDFSLAPILHALHPTPAVCGMPKEASRNFILKEEGYDRAYYAGYLGNLNWDIIGKGDDETDLFVNLRCMRLEDSKADLFIGCGITEDSVAGDEFVETENKSITMRKILN